MEQKERESENIHHRRPLQFIAMGLFGDVLGTVAAVTPVGIVANIVAPGSTDRLAKAAENTGRVLTGDEYTEIYNDTGVPMIAYSQNSSTGSKIAPGDTHRWNCYMWNGMIMKPSTGLYCAASFCGSDCKASTSFAYGKAVSDIASFIKDAFAHMWKAVVEAFKSAFDRIKGMLDIDKFFAKLAADVPKLGRMKSEKPTIVPDYYASAAAKKGGFAGILHQEVHNARETVEKVRFAYYETEAGLLEVYEALNSPAELAVEANVSDHGCRCRCHCRRHVRVCLSEEGTRAFPGFAESNAGFHEHVVYFPVPPLTVTPNATIAIYLTPPSPPPRCLLQCH